MDIKCALYILPEASGIRPLCSSPRAHKDHTQKKQRFHYGLQVGLFIEPQNRSSSEMSCHAEDEWAACNCVIRYIRCRANRALGILFNKQW